MDDNVIVQPKKQTVGFKVDNNIFCEIVLQSKKLKIFPNLKKSELHNQKNIAQDVLNVGHWGNGAYEIRLTDLEDINYILSLLKQLGGIKILYTKSTLPLLFRFSIFVRCVTLLHGNITLQSHCVFITQNLIYFSQRTTEADTSL